MISQHNYRTALSLQSQARLVIAQSTMLASRITKSRSLQVAVLSCKTSLYSFQYRGLSVAVTPQMVKELRERSGAPMMDCKKALADPTVAGDFEKAMNWLRMKGIAKAAQTERVSQEGLIAFLYTPQVSTLLEVNSETDFVGKNMKFHSFVTMVTQVCNTMPVGPVDVEVLLQQKDPTTSMTVKDALGDIVNQIRENIVIRRGLNISCNTEHSVLTGYVHGKVGAEHLPPSIAMGKSAAVVELKLSAPVTEPILDAGKRLAMHVVAAQPMYLDAASVPSSMVEAETKLFREQTEEAEKESKGKPKGKDILDKIIAGKVNKRLAEVCLLSQPHVAEEGSPSIQKYLQGLGSKHGGSIDLVRFERWTLGQK